ncbi:MAG TPA: hypothetical protein VM124_02790 [Candidatus Limnocylindrales bacterium]|nr:hypothetical protein [Candidatus Limnocylindrales bacterium]
MHVLEPRELEQRRKRRIHEQTHQKRRRVWPVLLLALVGVYVVVVSVIPLAPLKIETMEVTIPPKPSVSIPWPAYGQGAVGAVGFGMLAQNGDPKPLPIASVAKVVTALAVLKEHPINDGLPPPILTITAEDVATYNRYIAQDQSVVAVQAGEQLSEYQALQALLLPSANNMADVLVRWAFGTTENYLEFANALTKTLGMPNTHIADASGFSPQTVSTATDLAKLAEIAMNHPIIAEIVGQPQADLPVAGKVFNVNRLLGEAGVVGIKTGNTDEAGGCYLFSARRAIDAEHTVTLVGVIMGAPDLSQAIDDSVAVIDAGFSGFSISTPIQTSQIVGRIRQAGGTETSLVVGQGLTTVTWNGQSPKVEEVKINKIGPAVKQADEIGQLSLGVGDQSYKLPLAAAEAIPQHSYMWRLRHAAGYL